MIEATTAEDVIDIVPEIVEIMRDFNVKSAVKSVVAIFNFVSRIFMSLCAVHQLGVVFTR